jgi:aryl-alcohol dehydrogenase-like predicted oxidoreductase
MRPERFDPELPQNAAKFEALEQLVEVADSIGCTLPELAVAFVAAHPAVTSVIVGPRTMEQWQALEKGAGLVLDDATLDRIDEIVPPGTDTYRADGTWQPQALTEAGLRRRPIGDRAAA